MLPCSDAHLPARSSRELSAVCMSLTSTGPLARSTSLQACRAQAVSWNQPNSSQAENQPLQPLPGKGLSSLDTHRILRCYQLSNFGVIYQLLRVCTFQKPPELWSQPPAAGEVWEVGRGRKRPHHPPGGHRPVSRRS